jgi:hypothetical protein
MQSNWNYFAQSITAVDIANWAQISDNTDYSSFLTIVLWILNEMHNSIELKGIPLFPPLNKSYYHFL